MVDNAGQMHHTAPYIKLMVKTWILRKLICLLSWCPLQAMIKIAFLETKCIAKLANSFNFTITLAKCHQFANLQNVIKCGAFAQAVKLLTDMAQNVFIGKSHDEWCEKIPTSLNGQSLQTSEIEAWADASFGITNSHLA